MINIERSPADRGLASREYSSGQNKVERSVGSEDLAELNLILENEEGWRRTAAELQERRWDAIEHGRYLGGVQITGPAVGKYVIF